MKKGFTLVELSIVLVIIGLLIGGILVAQSMIETTKLQKQIKLFQQVTIAHTNFYTTYKAHPGDSRQITGGIAVAGDGDGEVLYNYIRWATFRGEPQQYFIHLQQLGYLANLITPVGVSQNGTIGVDFPANVYGKDKSGFIAMSSHKPDPAEVSYYNPIWDNIPHGVYLWLNVTSDITTGQIINDVSARPFTPSQTYALDTKLDDGLPNTGNFYIPQPFQNSYFNPTGNTRCRNSVSNVYINLSGAYDNLEGTHTCAPIFRIVDDSGIITY